MIPWKRLAKWAAEQAIKWGLAKAQAKSSVPTVTPRKRRKR